jgi:hypothetical protein
MPQSSPGGLPLNAAPGDMFNVGPGYATPLCYTRASNARGTWTWRHAVNVPGEYNLYIFGLSDSINTTEFLEENDNASLDVLVWNYGTGAFETLCERKQYGKEDSFLAGRITGDHVSPKGDVKLQLVAHDVTEDVVGMDEAYDEMVRVQSRKSGYAWFNYAVLAPVPVVGRVNINTASARMLKSLPGVDAQLAHALYHGLDSSGRATLKPYRRAGDLLDVKGMDLATFERIVNLVMVDSSTYTVCVEAQALAPEATIEGVEPSHIDGRQHKRFIVEAVPGTGGPGTVRVLEQTRL